MKNRIKVRKKLNAINVKKNRKKKQRVLKNLHAKEDESSKFLSDFNSSNDRKAKSPVNPNLCWSF